MTHEVLQTYSSEVIIEDLKLKKAKTEMANGGRNTVDVTLLKDALKIERAYQSYLNMKALGLSLEKENFEREFQVGFLRKRRPVTFSNDGTKWTAQYQSRHEYRYLSGHTAEDVLHQLNNSSKRI